MTIEVSTVDDTWITKQMGVIDQPSNTIKCGLMALTAFELSESERRLYARSHPGQGDIERWASPDVIEMY